MKLPARGVACILLLAGFGCASTGVEARIHEKPDAFTKLDPWQQRDIRAGLVNVGYTADMVYIALGKPSKIVTTADGRDTIWTYENYYSPYSDSHPQNELNPGQGSEYRTTMASTNGPAINPMARNSAGTRGTPQTNLGVAELPADTLHVTFRDGKVFLTKLDSDK